MDIKISPGGLSGSVRAISSKSDMHRALICAAFSDKSTRISCNVLSKDIEATARCLRAMGADISHDESRGEFIVDPVKFEARDERIQKACCTANAKEITALDCGESGSTLRFILPVAAAMGGEFYVTGEGKLPERPLGPLMTELSRHGISFSADKLPLYMKGKLTGNEFEIAGNISSQFITGLLLAFPILDSENKKAGKSGSAPELKLTTHLESEAYVDISLSVMKAFGKEVEKSSGGSKLNADAGCKGYPDHKDYKGYISPGSYTVDGDWSNGAMWLCADAIEGNSIEVTGLKNDSPQGDRQVTEILQKMSTEEKLTVDVSGVPDLVPALAAAAALKEGCVSFINAGRLRIKECDRLSAIAENLKKLSVRVEETPDSLTVWGRPELKGGVRLRGFNDHRMVMSAAILGAACREPVVIEESEAVSKSYPGFFEDFRKLGGKADVI